MIKEKWAKPTLLFFISYLRLKNLNDIFKATDGYSGQVISIRANSTEKYRFLPLSWLSQRTDCGAWASTNSPYRPY